MVPATSFLALSGWFQGTYCLVQCIHVSAMCGIGEYFLVINIRFLLRCGLKFLHPSQESDYHGANTFKCVYDSDTLNGVMTWQSLSNKNSNICRCLTEHKVWETERV